MSDDISGSSMQEGNEVFRADKKGRCKRSGQGKTLDQGATNQRQ